MKMNIKEKYCEVALNFFDDQCKSFKSYKLYKCQRQKKLQESVFPILKVYTKCMLSKSDNLTF